eukprot:84869_1
MSSSTWCSVGKREERELLVSGYNRLYYNALIPTDISNLILTFYDAVAYWDFNSSQLAKFYAKEYKEVLLGPKIRFNNIVFQCTLCPSGWSHKGCIQFYVEFDREEMNGKLPKHIRTITAYLVIYCAQIEYEYRTPKIFINIESAQGWPAYRIDDIRLNNFKSLNFGCYIELLHVETTPAHAPSMMCYDQFFDKTHQISTHSSCKWLVQDGLLHRFKNAKHSQGFYSPNFDDDSWCISCSPFGIKQEYEGQFCIALKVLRLPFGCESIKVKHEIKIRSDDGKFNVNISDIKEFDYHRRASRFTKDMKDIGSFKNAKCLTFMVHVQLIHNQCMHSPCNTKL